MKSFAKTEDANGDLLVPLIIDKLTGHLRIQIARDHGDDAWTLKDIMSAIYTENQAGEAGNVPPNDISCSQFQNYHSRLKMTLLLHFAPYMLVLREGIQHPSVFIVREATSPLLP